MPCSVPSRGLAFLRLDSVKKETECFLEHSNLGDGELSVVINYCPVEFPSFSHHHSLGPWSCWKIFVLIHVRNLIITNIKSLFEMGFVSQDDKGSLCITVCLVYGKWGNWEHIRASNPTGRRQPVFHDGRLSLVKWGQRGLHWCPQTPKLLLLPAFHNRRRHEWCAANCSKVCKILNSHVQQSPFLSLKCW